MVKISKTKHITKKGVVKRNPRKNNIKTNILKIGDLVKWNGDNSGRIDKVTEKVIGFSGLTQYYTEEINPKEGKEPKIGKQFYDYTGEYKNKGVGIVKLHKNPPKRIIL